jgi:hypothetical protein
MTPKEKAKELVNKFKNRSIKLGESHSQLLAEANALIAVDECINILDEICKSRGYDLFESPLYNLKYWKEVKQEIDKL